MRRWWLAPLLAACTFAALGGWFIKYRSVDKVSVRTGLLYICTDPDHAGAETYRDDTSIVLVSRADAARMRVQEMREVCDTCRQARQAEAERRRADEAKAKEAEDRAMEVEEATRRKAMESTRQLQQAASKVRGRFMVAGDGGRLGYADDTNTAIKREPGDELAFWFEIENLTDEPLVGVKMLVKPGRYLVLEPAIQTAGRGPDYEREARALDAKRQKLLRDLTTTGALIVGRNRTSIMPRRSNYYATERVQWASVRDDPSEEYTYKGDFMNSRGLRVMRLDAGAPTGQTITYSGFLIVDGHEVHLNDVVVHVMHR